MSSAVSWVQSAKATCFVIQLVVSLVWSISVTALHLITGYCLIFWATSIYRSVVYPSLSFVTNKVSKMFCWYLRMTIMVKFLILCNFFSILISFCQMSSSFLSRPYNGQVSERDKVPIGKGNVRMSLKKIYQEISILFNPFTPVGFPIDE